MTIDIAANMPGSFESEIVGTSTSTNFINGTDYAPLSMHLLGDNRVRHYLPTGWTEVWFHFVAAHDIVSQSYLDSSFAQFFSGSSVAAYVKTANANISIALEDGVDIATGGTFAGTRNPQTYDIHLKLDNTNGIFEVYQDKSLICSFYGDTVGTFGTVDMVQIMSPYRHFTYGHFYVSEIVVADEDTKGMRVKSHTTTADGTTNSLAAGTYAAMATEGVPDYETYGQADAAGQEFLGALEDRPTSLLVPYAVCVSAAASCDEAAGPQNLNLAVRSGAADYFSGNLALSAAPGPYRHVWAADPATTLDWDDVSINALEAGFRAAA